MTHPTPPKKLSPAQLRLLRDIASGKASLRADRMNDGSFKYVLVGNGGRWGERQRGGTVENLLANGALIRRDTSIEAALRQVPTPPKKRRTKTHCPKCLKLLIDRSCLYCGWHRPYAMPRSKPPKRRTKSKPSTLANWARRRLAELEMQSTPTKPSGGAKAVKEKYHRWAALDQWGYSRTQGWEDLRLLKIYINRKYPSTHKRFTYLKQVIAPADTHSVVANADVELAMAGVCKQPCHHASCRPIHNVMSVLGLTAPKAGGRRGK